MMKEFDINFVINHKSYLDGKIEEFTKNKILKKQNPDKDEISGHIEKAENNLRFVRDNLSLGYYDWCITGCYYACYHIVLAMILTRIFFQKSFCYVVHIDKRILQKWDREGRLGDDRKAVYRLPGLDILC